MLISSGSRGVGGWGGVWGESGHPDPEIRRPGLKKTFFGPSGLSLVYK